ncbi:hypothetical protein [Psychroserpens luteus]|uniref:Uncharacterized protein n=1 Tax=Psychroserpens luteus TaxID=1434066 RepID=A0ABW5ZQ37_9FLAO|nr:hypothetical protein [Psychroserpens luteus]
MMFQNIALYNTNVTIIMVVVFALVCLALVGFLIKAMASSGKKEIEADTETKD